jgi:hypothetical protein
MAACGKPASHANPSKPNMLKGIDDGQPISPECVKMVDDIRQSGTDNPGANQNNGEIEKRIRIRFSGGQLLELNEAAIIKTHHMIHLSYRYHLR